ncbi:hypothetical protein X777_01125 [Ooceraea biroi]|uniref:Uncharacterized protein n=1 Tax=Ooceraea biroi TaxID=2015173 RepID=A0A026VTJ6_OOCBI|nr:hypothetical protein X777_01125 [Ooceraea biroi]
MHNHGNSQLSPMLQLSLVTIEVSFPPQTVLLTYPTGRLDCTVTETSVAIQLTRTGLQSS